ncbi:MAG TPA: hypothetical protein VFJ94_08790 [Intrasporangium sp.]|uniref:hypothetical protein n=1 Tax=Intrasporangium sp. TaxID=1925024 RepID=UPI002D78167A|nr:hypothetical protein [Intrasporangium sp.]HET7398605.1 hypothetical protein [Intrasporangium sp.]
MTSPIRGLTPEVVRLLTLDTEPWLSCDDCFALMDRYVEAVLRDPRATTPAGMRAHLDGCPACAEEVESLLQLVAEDGAGA